MSKPKGGGLPNGAQTEPNQGLKPAPNQKPNQKPNQRPRVPPPSSNSNFNYVNDDHFSQMHFAHLNPSKFPDKIIYYRDGGYARSGGEQEFGVLFDSEQ